MSQPRAHLWSSISVCTLSKGVRSASVQPAPNAAMTRLWVWVTETWPASTSTRRYCSYVPNISAVVTLFCSSGGRMPRYKLT